MNNYIEMSLEKQLEWVSVAAELHQLKQLIKEQEKKEAELSTLLRKLSDNKSAMLWNYIYNCEYRRGVIDYDLIPEIKTINLEQYRKPVVQSWKLVKL